MSANTLNIGSELARVRKEKKISQGSVAKLLATTQSHVSGIERGAFDSRLSTVQDFARALDLELVAIPRSLLPAVDALIPDTPEKARRPRFQPRPD